MSADQRKPLDGTLFFVSQVILAIISIPAFVPKPGQTLAFVLVGWHFYRIISTQTTGGFDSDFTFGTAIGYGYIWVLDYAILTPPENLRDFHDEDPTPVTERPLMKRILWALKLFSNPRCIGWAHEFPHLPPRPSASIPRLRFVISRILQATLCFFIAAGASRYDAAYAGMTTADKLLVGAPLRRRVPGVLSFGLAVLCMISGVNAVVAATAVGCGISSPKRWPLLFGSPSEVWSIRRFWGRFWHQLIRSSVLSCTSSMLGCIFPAKYVGTTGYKLARLYLVFCISGLAHSAGEVMARRELGFNSIVFFMLQPFGITIELVISSLWHRLQSNDANDGGTRNIERAPEKDNHKSLAKGSTPPLWIRCVGGIWVALWMVWTAAYMADGSRI